MQCLVRPAQWLMECVLQVTLLLSKARRLTDHRRVIASVPEKLRSTDTVQCCILEMRWWELCTQHCLTGCPVGSPIAAYGQEKSRRFGHSLGEERPAPLLVADCGTEEFEVARCVPRTAREVGRGERLGRCSS